MPRASTRSAHFGGSPEEVEAAFYEAMQQGHLEQLMACWADEDDIVCVHPGGPRLVGALAIRGNFEAMFGNGPVRVFPERVRTSTRWPARCATCLSAWKCSLTRAHAMRG